MRGPAHLISEPRSEAPDGTLQPVEVRHRVRLTYDALAIERDRLGRQLGQRLGDQQLVGRCHT